MQIEFLQSLDPVFWILTALIILTSFWSFTRLRSHPRFSLLLAVRGLSLLALTLLLLQPLLTNTKSITRKLGWNIYIDNSVSMGYHQGVSLQALNAGIEEIESKVNNVELESSYWHFARDVVPAENLGVNGIGSATDLGKVLDHIQNHQDNLAAAVLITDGQMTQGERPKVLNRRLIPIHIVGVGDSIPMVDISIKSIDAPTVSIKGEDVNVEVVLQGQGPLKKRMNVSLYEKDKLLASKRIRIPGGGAEKTVRFRFKPTQIGTRTYTAKVSSVQEEINISNNHQSFAVKVLKDRYPVALITGSPNYNTAYLKRVIRSYPRIKVDHFIQRNPEEFRTDFNTFWSTSYDLIVFDNFPVSNLPPDWQRIFGKKILSDKSALAWVLGPNVTYENTRTLVPFFHVSVKDRPEKDQAHGWYFTDQFNYQQFIQTEFGSNGPEFPPLSTHVMFEPASRAISILAHLEGSSSVPLLLRGEVEGLRSLIWSSPEMSTLYYKLSRGNRAGFFTEFWHGMFDWLLRSGGANDLYFRLNKVSYQQGEEIVITGTQAGGDKKLNARAFINIAHNGKEVNSSELHYDINRSRWEGRLWASKPGSYSFEILLEQGSGKTSQQGTFEVRESQIELNKVYLNSGPLQDLAQKTGGQYIPWTSRADLSHLLKTDSRTETQVTKIKFNENPWLLLGLILLLSAEWVVRRWSGLP